jgi:Ricin-type beta-trefoil lectin domain
MKLLNTVFSVGSGIALLSLASGFFSFFNAKPAIAGCGWGDITCSPQNWDCPVGGCPPKLRPRGSSNSAILSTSTRLCLDPKDYGRGGDGTQIQLWDCTKEASQKWSWINGSLVNEATRLCLDPKNYGREGNGTPIQLWKCTNEPQQKWSWNNGSLVNEATGLCLDPQNYGRGGAGTQIQLWGCTKEPQQKWLEYKS